MRRRPRPHLLFAGVALLGVLLAAPPVQAQDEGGGAEGIRLAAEAGYDGRYLVGRRVPVLVSIEADRLVRGVVEVSIEGEPGTWSAPVEVPGGSDKQVVVVVPTPFSFPIDSLRVRLVGDGDPVAIEVDLEPLESEELVGLLPGVTPADRPQPLPFPQEVGTARFVEIDTDTLAIGGAIDPLGTLVAGVEEVAALGGDSRGLVLDWVDRGGRLVVDARPGTPIEGLPDEWQPGTSGRAVAGLGEVRVSGGRAAAGDWAAVVEPTPTASLAELLNFGGIQVSVEPVGDSVARDAGLDALELPWLLGFLAAYVLLAGPAGFFFIRRRRPALGWVVIPGLAVAFTGLAFVVGADLREGTRAAHGTVLEMGPAGTRATTVVGTVSRTGGDGTVDFPSGWTAGSVDTFTFGPGAAGATELAISSTGAGTEGRIPLAAGGFGVIRGSGPAGEAGSGSLVVEARSEGTSVVGTVRNDLPYAVEEVGLFVGRSGERLGDIASGESVAFEVTGSEFRLGDAFTPPEAEVWPEQAGFGPGIDFEGVVNLSLLNEALLGLGPNSRPRGVVTVIGWTRSVPSPVDVAGQDAPEGRSAVVTRAPVASGDGLAAGAVRRGLVRGTEGIDLPDDDQLGGRLEGGLWRFTLPAGSADGPLELVIPRYVRRVDVWDGTAWQVVDVDPEELDDFNFDGDISRSRTAPLPANGRQGDVMWVRGFLFGNGGVVDGTGLDIRSPQGAAP